MKQIIEEFINSLNLGEIIKSVVDNHFDCSVDVSTFVTFKWNYVYRSTVNRLHRCSMILKDAVIKIVAVAALLNVHRRISILYVF